MSYLRGPMTRVQIKALMDPLRSRLTAVGATAPAETSSSAHVETAIPRQVGPSMKGARPVLPPSISQYFIPIRGNQPAGHRLVYSPMLLGHAQVHFADVKSGVDVVEESTYIAPITDDPIPVDWNNGVLASFDIADLEKSASEAGEFMSLPPAASNPKSYDVWNREFADWLYRNQKLELLKSPTFKVLSKPGESERDFRVRLQQTVREQRDEAIERAKQRYAAKLAALEEKVRRAQQAVEREAEQARQQKMQTAISAGATLLSAFMGRKALSYSSLSRGTTTVRSAGRIMKEAQDVQRAKETLATYQQQFQELENEFRAEMQQLQLKIDPLSEELETVTLRPAKKDISVKLVALVWVPGWQAPDGSLVPAY